MLSDDLRMPTRCMILLYKIHCRDIFQKKKNGKVENSQVDDISRAPRREMVPRISRKIGKSRWLVLQPDLPLAISLCKRQLQSG